MGYKEVVKREIKRLNSGWLGWIISFITPLLFCILVCLIFMKASPADLPIGILNSDNSQFSRTLTRYIDSLPSCNVNYNVTSYEEGRNLLIEGKIYGLVVIPKNFQRDIYRMAHPKLVFYYNNQRILIGGIISKDINTLVQSLLVGLDAKMKNKKGLPMKLAIKQSNVINVAEHIRSNPYFNYQYLISLTAMGHILQISLILTSIWAIGTEFKLGKTKDWLESANGSIIVAFFGKITPYFLLFSIIFAILYFIYFVILQSPYEGNIFTGILATGFFIMAGLTFGALFMSMNGNFRYCIAGGSFYAALGFSLAGVTFPLMAMPLIVKCYASTMPLVYWIQIMLNESTRHIPSFYSIKYFIQFACIILIAFCSLYRLKKLALDEKRWFLS